MRLLASLRLLLPSIIINLFHFSCAICLYLEQSQRYTLLVTPLVIQKIRDSQVGLPDVITILFDNILAKTNRTNRNKQEKQKPLNHPMLFKNYWKKLISNQATH